MKLAEFKERVVGLMEHDYESADDLVFQWLMEASKDYGSQGATARKLLELAKELMQ